MRHALLALVLATLAAVAVPTSAQACYWDRDTLAMERRQFPGLLELITGKFVRHSQAFYQWRIKDREAKRKAGVESADLFDDLAVAYDKVGRHDDAIRLMKEAEKRWPGRYETWANLGTFYFHKRELERGLEAIDRALEINPDAHFGRERIQKYLAEYVRSKMQGGGLSLPLSTESRHKNFERAREQLDSLVKLRGDALQARIMPTMKPIGFAAFLVAKDVAIADGIEGVSGMIRFGNHGSPVLLEALGDLLLYEKKYYEGSKHLAARAYLRAAASVIERDAEAAKSYRAKAILALAGQPSHSLKMTEKSFARQLRAGERFFAAIARNEKRWIENSPDPERAFDRKYFGKKRRRAR